MLLDINNINIVLVGNEILVCHWQVYKDSDEGHWHCEWRRQVRQDAPAEYSDAAAEMLQSPLPVWWSRARYGYSDWNVVPVWWHRARSTVIGMLFMNLVAWHCGDSGAYCVMLCSSDVNRYDNLKLNFLSLSLPFLTSDVWFIVFFK